MSGWPRLDYASDRSTYQFCHLLLQLIGKLPTRLHPWINHGWHVALRMTPHSYITRPMPTDDGRTFTAELDVHAPCVRIACETGAQWTMPIVGKTIAQVQRDLAVLLQQAGLPAPLHGGPNEMPKVVPFADDHEPRDWNDDAACRLHGAFLCADRVFTRFRSQYVGKSSPSHLFWGAFDLAVTRFSGREAPLHPGGFPNLPDAVTREAYSHEVISAGMWPGDGLGEAAFYAYAYPSPDRFAAARVMPEGAAWHAGLGEFVLPYRYVAQAADPDAALMAFLQSSYEGAAKLLDWPAGLSRPAASVGAPPPRQLH